MAAACDTLELTSLTEFIAAIDIPGFPDDELAAMVVGGERLRNAVNAFCAAGLEELERRGTCQADGALSAAGWVTERTGSSKPALRARTRAGAALRLLPSATVAARDGRLSPEHLDALAGCVRRYGEVAARDESLLVTQALELDADAFRLAARHWQDRAADLVAPEASPAPEPVDELHFSQTLGGRYRLDGNFSPETGALVHAALEAEVDRQLRAARDGDPSVGLVASEVRAAALVDLLCLSMRREPSDTSAPDRYRVAVVVPFDQAAGLPMAACDSPAFRVVLGAESEVLDIGHLTHRWPAGIRRAITHRDGGCVFPSCDRPPSWSDIHHCQHWEHGGRTSVDNGVLLCRRHHTFIHKRGWSIAVEQGRPVTRRPDGQEHVIVRWDTTPPRPGAVAGIL